MESIADKKPHILQVHFFKTEMETLFNSIEVNCPDFLKMNEKDTFYSVMFI